jgi:hypothetical protein
MTRRNRSQQSVQRIRQTAKRIALVVGGIFAVALTVSLFFDEMGVRRYIAMQKHARELELDIKELEQMIFVLRLGVSNMTRLGLKNWPVNDWVLSKKERRCTSSFRNRSDVE